MNKKSKSRTNPMAELNFVAAVQLEEAVQMVGDIADSHHKVILTEVSENEFKFRINYLPNNAKEAEIWGTLQRWQGVETKLHAHGDVIHRQPEKSALDHNQRMMIFFLLVFGFVTLAFYPQLGASMIMIIGVYAAFFSWRKQSLGEKSTVFFRARDYLLQRIIDTFKAVAKVESV